MMLLQQQQKIIRVKAGWQASLMKDRETDLHKICNKELEKFQGIYKTLFIVSFFFIFLIMAALVWLADGATTDEQHHHHQWISPYSPHPPNEDNPIKCQTNTSLRLCCILKMKLWLEFGNNIPEMLKKIYLMNLIFG